ncbi:MAG: hypothetical protein R3B90_00445 [Planctomycetaceae bacterium]
MTLSTLLNINRATAVKLFAAGIILAGSTNAAKAQCAAPGGGAATGAGGAATAAFGGFNPLQAQLLQQQVLQQQLAQQMRAQAIAAMQQQALLQQQALRQQAYLQQQAVAREQTLRRQQQLSSSAEFASSGNGACGRSTSGRGGSQPVKRSKSKDTDATPSRFVATAMTASQKAASQRFWAGRASSPSSLSRSRDVEEFLASVR